MKARGLNEQADLLQNDGVLPSLTTFEQGSPIETALRGHYDRLAQQVADDAGLPVDLINSIVNDLSTRDAIQASNLLQGKLDAEQITDIVANNAARTEGRTLAQQVAPNPIENAPTITETLNSQPPAGREPAARAFIAELPPESLDILATDPLGVGALTQVDSILAAGSADTNGIDPERARIDQATGRQDAQGLTEEQQDVLLDLTQLGLGITGVADPTPASDGASFFISVFRGDWLGAGIDLASAVFPFVGDLLKAGRLPQFIKSIDDAVRIAGTDSRFAELARPALETISGLLNGIPVEDLPAAARRPIESIRTKLDEFLAPGGRPIPGGTHRVIDPDGNLGKITTISGNEVRIGDTLPVGRRADGRLTVGDVNGNEQLVRRPDLDKPGVSATVDPETGFTTYSKNGMSVIYHANGFPVFDSVADVYLPTDKVVGTRPSHNEFANKTLGRLSDQELNAMGFDSADIQMLRAGDKPEEFTWHHHQDIGRLQLVKADEHVLFSGGHTGGHALWGDPEKFAIIKD